MLCDKCQLRPATIHLTTIMAGRATRMDLCADCGADLTPPNGTSLDQLINQLGSTAGDPGLANLETLSGETRFSVNAFLFIREVVSAALMRAMEPVAGDGVRHVSGGELLAAFRTLALERFGTRARATLRNWGIERCEDVGEIIFKMVEAGLLLAQPGDRREDFENGYPFSDAFPEI
jgi:uncharacterized repeat protein (TIGR04138 family)